MIIAGMTASACASRGFGEFAAYHCTIGVEENGPLIFMVARWRRNS
jgi:hypothetical protein